MTDEANAAPAEPANSRLLVAKPATNRGMWIFVGVLALAGTGLFSALEARRSTISSPATAVPRATAAGIIASPPELQVAPDYAEFGAPQFAAQPSNLMLPARSAPIPAIVRPQVRQSTSYASPSPPSYAPPSANFEPSPPAPAFAYRAPTQAAVSPLQDNERGAAGSGKERVNATRFVNPGTTVPQGTIIQAVLETALDSNRAGFARAVISRDVMSFDGSRILIPRGSRLFGEYKADLSLGQNRALIQWRRLTRPDGGIVDVDSPSADPLGRAGVKGKVNSHFFTRFGGAILQSALDIGTNIASRSVSGDNYYIGLPNATEGLIQQKPEQVKPTLTLKQGSSVSVFVARDLDFTAVE